MNGVPAIAFRGVELELRGDRIYQQIDFEIAQAEFACILGPSGCGKSTSLRIMGGLLPVSKGDVQIGGRPPEEAWNDIAFVFQSPRLVPWRTALDNVLLGTDLRVGKSDRAVRKTRALELLDLVGLSADAAKYPSMLSGGERQRVSIARALAVDPKIVLMDEPFSALDPTTRERMRLEIERIWQATGKTIVFVTHDIEESLQLADRILVLSKKPTRVLEAVPVSLPRPRSMTDAPMAALRARLRGMFDAPEDHAITSPLETA